LGIKTAGSATHKPVAKIDASLMKLTQDLTRRYMTKVELKGTQSSGSIQIQFSSREDLSRIFSLLMGE
jgi:hypothetical protein